MAASFALGLYRSLFGHIGRFTANQISQANEQACKNHEREMRHAGQQAQQAQHTARNQQRALVAVHLLGQLFREVVFGGHAGDQNTCGRRNDQSWNLRHQAVTNGERAVHCERFAKAQVVRDHARDQTAHQVDDQNQNARHGVAAYKLRGTIHGAEEVGLLCHLGPALLGFFLLDQAGIQVGINGHLLAGHGI